MKLVSFTRLGQSGFGALTEGGIVDLTGIAAPGIISIRSALAASALPRLAAYVREQPPAFSLSDVTLLPVVPDPGKILCVGLNYQTHVAETGRKDSPYPVLFVRFADSQVAHLQPILKPTFSDALDYEGEMAVVIGKGGRHIPKEAAMTHVAGYACYNDATVRDWQRHSHQFTAGKTFPGTGAFGPCLVTADEIADYTALPIQTRVNGEIVQNATLADLIFSIPDLISYISRFTPLAAGDVILTGTPGGVGDRRTPPTYLHAGDRVDVEIGPLGILTNSILELD